jgi:HD-like signal output (HDOD) protein
VLAIGRHYPKENAVIVARVAEDRVARWEVERELLGMDHAEIGGKLAEHWAFPPMITTVIAHHHDFMAAPEEARWLAAVVALADSLCNEDESATMGEGARVGTIEEAVALLGLAPDALASIVDETRAASARDLLVLESIGGY